MAYLPFFLTVAVMLYTVARRRKSSGPRRRAANIVTLAEAMKVVQVFTHCVDQHLPTTDLAIVLADHIDTAALTAVHHKLETLINQEAGTS